MDRVSNKSPEWLDGIAVFLSALCLLHCLAMPVLIASLPLLTQFGDEHFHEQIVMVIVPVSVIALAFGYRKHADLRVVVAGITGMLVLILGATVVHDRMGETADTIVTVFGSLTLAAAHYYNSALRPDAHN